MGNFQDHATEKRCRGWGTWRVFLVVLFLSLGVTACSKEPPAESQTLVYAMPNEISNLDPNKTLDTYSIQVIGQVLEGLVGLDDNNQVIPLLAERWHVNDNADIWTFHLREDVWFHTSEVFGADNARMVTAEDVRYSFERLLQSDAAPGFALADVIQGVTEYQDGAADRVSGIKVVEEGVIEFHLSRPDASFVNRISSPWFAVVAKEAVEQGDDVFGRTNLVGTGPYRLITRSDTEVNLQRHDRYWRSSSGNIDTLVFSVVKNEQIRLAELRNGRISVLQLTPGQATAVRTLGADGAYQLNGQYSDFNLAGFETFNSHVIGFNTEAVDPVVRRAIAYGINRREIVEGVMNDMARIAAGPVPAGLPDYTPSYTDDLYDPDKAAELLETLPERPSLELLVHDKAASEEVGTLIQAQLKPLGMDITLRKVDFNTAIGMIVSGEAVMYSIFFEYLFSSPDQILNNMFSSQKIPVPNFWLYQSADFDQLLKSLWRTADTAERTRIAHQLEDIVVKDAPAAFLFQQRNELLYRSNFEGVALNGHNIPLLWQVRVQDQ